MFKITAEVYARLSGYLLDNHGGSTNPIHLLDHQSPEEQLPGHGQVLEPTAAAAAVVTEKKSSSPSADATTSGTTVLTQQPSTSDSDILPRLTWLTSTLRHCKVTGNGGEGTSSSEDQEPITSSIADLKSRILDELNRRKAAARTECSSSSSQVSADLVQVPVPERNQPEQSTPPKILSGDGDDKPPQSRVNNNGMAPSKLRTLRRGPGWPYKWTMALLLEIEAKHDEQQDSSEGSSPPIRGAHLKLPYRNPTLLDDAIDLLFNHVHRQTTISMKDKEEMKKILTEFITELFAHPRVGSSASDDDDEEENEEDAEDSPAAAVEAKPQSPNKIMEEDGTKLSEKKDKQGSEQESESATSTASGASKVQQGSESDPTSAKRQVSAEEEKFLSMTGARLKKYAVKHEDQEESYKLFFANEIWYLFLRLHQILCERLTKFLEEVVALLSKQSEEPEAKKEEESPPQAHSNSSAIPSGMKSELEAKIWDYYSTFLDYVKDLLDGKLDANGDNYEDRLREIFGSNLPNIRHHLDNANDLPEIITTAALLLRELVTERGSQNCMKFYLEADQASGTGGPIATAPLRKRVRSECLYQARYRNVFGETNCVKVVIFQKSCVMTMELLVKNDGYLCLICGMSYEFQSELQKHLLIGHYFSKIHGRRDDGDEKMHPVKIIGAHYHNFAKFREPPVSSFSAYSPPGFEVPFRAARPTDSLYPIFGRCLNQKCQHTCSSVDEIRDHVFMDGKLEKSSWEDEEDNVITKNSFFPCAICTEVMIDEAEYLKHVLTCVEDEAEEVGGDRNKADSISVAFQQAVGKMSKFSQ